MSSRSQCYCAFCKTPRTISRKRRISFANVFAALAGAGVITLAIWHEFDPRSLLIFVVLLAVAETFVQIRWRLDIVCKECGFDPVLYLRDASLAAAKVQKHMDARAQDPSSLFKAPLRIPKVTQAHKDEMARQIKVSKAVSAKKTGGGLISKSV